MSSPNMKSVNTMGYTAIYNFISAIDRQITAMRRENGQRAVEPIISTMFGACSAILSEGPSSNISARIAITLFFDSEAHRCEFNLAYSGNRIARLLMSPSKVAQDSLKGPCIYSGACLIVYAADWASQIATLIHIATKQYPGQNSVGNRSVLSIFEDNVLLDAFSMIDYVVRSQNGDHFVLLSPNSKSNKVLTASNVQYMQSAYELFYRRPAPFRTHDQINVL
ncbi:hypothetical protein BDN70DRAFT_891269 [Pholiota conissans]|uniref:Uncharacterized protein n=1 Tax=Pholiota conissans TaxID=109636 RepID=A0A9P5Z9I3_9AGAR|nr:hypothetical protein BDN70DRAFT_891269 [Pholiota conissans]